MNINLSREHLETKIADAVLAVLKLNVFETEEITTSEYHEDNNLVVNIDHNGKKYGGKITFSVNI